MVKQLNKNKQAEQQDGASNLGDLFSKHQNTEEKLDTKPSVDTLGTVGNLGISADDFLATLGGQSLQEYTQA